MLAASHLAKPSQTRPQVPTRSFRAARAQRRSIHERQLMREMPLRSLRLLQRFTNPSGSVSPFWLWQVTAAAATNSQGEFRMDRVIAGHYMLVVRLPEQMRVRAAPTALIEISESSPNASIGQVSLRRIVGKRTLPGDRAVRQ